jgi:hypothetical protein
MMRIQIASGCGVNKKKLLLAPGPVQVRAHARVYVCVVLFCVVLWCVCVCVNVCVWCYFVSCCGVRVIVAMISYLLESERDPQRPLNRTRFSKNGA